MVREIMTGMTTDEKLRGIAETITRYVYDELDRDCEWHTGEDHAIKGVLCRVREAYALDREGAGQKHDLRSCPAMRALESLTVGGSEFVDDIPRCVDHIKQRQEGMMNTIRRKATPTRNPSDREGVMTEELADSVATEIVSMFRNKTISWSREPRAIQEVSFLLQEKFSLSTRNQVLEEAAKAVCKYCRGEHSDLVNETAEMGSLWGMPAWLHKFKDGTGEAAVCAARAIRSLKDEGGVE